jgi:hypothetical protein
MKSIYGDSTSYSSLKDAQKFAKFQTETAKLQGPKILSDVVTLPAVDSISKENLLASTKGLRFMGQRFVPDAYIFNNLTQGDEAPDKETGQKLPSMTTAMMVMSVMGSKKADVLVNEWVQKNDPKSDKVVDKNLNKMETEFGKFDTKTWTQNVYWAWLYNLQPLFQEYKTGYPMFMQNDAWTTKNLMATLGSFTELKHDTLLYAKQNYAERGGGGPEPPPIPPSVRGYVEPDLVYLKSRISMSTLRKAGL